VRSRSSDEATDEHAALRAGDDATGAAVSALAKRYRPAPSRAQHAIIEETLVSQQVFDQAIVALLRQVRLDRRFDVPYLAGSSRDGRTIYIDRHVPRTLRVRGGRVRIAPFIMLHEAIEKMLFDRFRLTYAHAHQFALRLEQVAVRNAGVPWHAYNRLTQACVKQVEDERLRRIPPDLEIKPYRDEHDLALLRRMQRAGGHRLRSRS
jgi:hypothetical protein